MSMPPAVDILEAALLELEYAIADVNYEKSATTTPAEHANLTVLFSKLVAANCAVLVAISALATRASTDSRRLAA